MKIQVSPRGAESNDWTNLRARDPNKAWNAVLSLGTPYVRAVVSWKSVGLRYPGRSDLFKRVGSIGNLPDNVGKRISVLGESTAPAGVIYGAP